MGEQNIIIVNYNGGNVHSVENALMRLGVRATVSDDPDVILSADKVIFPGVGEASSAMKYLKERELDTVLKNVTQPFLGICLGQQLMCSHSEEGDVECLGIFDAQVKKFRTNDSQFKIPQMGWNSIYHLQGDLFEGIPEYSFVYFVHSYYVQIVEETVGTCEYILPFSAALQKDNYYSCQFHPEKSADIGSRLLKNFVNL